MARASTADHKHDAIPVVEFIKVDEDETTKLVGVSDKNARTYGYNDLTPFVRPEHYIRHIEPLEADLARQVEYDMDEQDQEFLDAVNAERKKEQLDRATYELFEIIIDRLEKEWFDLTKNIPKPDFALPSEDSTCAICDDSEGENTNAIVFCDGCNLAVHQECYGVPYIPEGQWLCRKCTVSPENPVSCVLCPNEGGAFKQTVNGDWIHLLCAMWIPETQVVNETVMEPIANLDRVNKARYRLKCSICKKQDSGACIQCNRPSCFVAFHVTCARKEKLMMPMKGPQGTPAPPLVAYCERHLPPDQAAAREASLEAEAEDEEDEEGGVAHTKSKSARAYAKTYRPPIPLVPAIVVDRVLAYTGKIQLRKKPEFVSLICRYWSLKREARRGAPLLKRLHLEPWTASNAGQAQTEEERVAKLEQLTALKGDLEKVRELAALTCKREARKLHQATALRDLLAAALFYNEGPLRAAFEKVTSHDKQNYFRFPVTKHEAPDYFDVVARPMSWSVIEEKLNKHEYWDVETFKEDVNLVLSNALLYNKSATPFYKAAHRLKAHMETIWQEMDVALGKELKAASETPTEIDQEQRPAAEDVKQDVKPGSLQNVGDLEPTLWALSLLASRDAIQPACEYGIDDDPLSSLLAYEAGKLVPPPPPPPREPTPPPTSPPRRPSPPSRAPSKKNKKAAKAEAERDNRRRRQRAEEHEARERQLTEEAEKQALFEEEMAREARERRSRSTTSTPRMPPFVPGGQRDAEAHRAPVTAVYADVAPRTRRSSAQEATFMSEAMATQTPGAGPSTTEVQDKSASSERPRKRRRTTPVQEVERFEWPVLPAVKEDIDKKDTFKYFNAGWMLPPGTKRGNRGSLDRPPPPPPPPLKKRRPSHAKSGLSISSTAASDNQTLPTPSRSRAKKRGRQSRATGSRSRRGRPAPQEEEMDVEDQEEEQADDAPDDQMDEEVHPSEEGDQRAAEPSSATGEQMQEDENEDDDEREAREQLAPSSEAATFQEQSDPEEGEDSQRAFLSAAPSSSPQRSPRRARRARDAPMSSAGPTSPLHGLPPVPPPTDVVPQAPTPPKWPSPAPYMRGSASKWDASQDPGWAATAGAYTGRSHSRPAPAEPMQSQHSYASPQRERTYVASAGHSRHMGQHDERAGWHATSATYASRAPQAYGQYAQQPSTRSGEESAYWLTAQNEYVSPSPSTRAEFTASQHAAEQYASTNGGYSSYSSQFQGYQAPESSTYEGSWPPSPQEHQSQRPFSRPSVPTRNLERLVAAATSQSPSVNEYPAGGALELLAALAPSPQAPFSAPSPQEFAASSPQATQELPPFTRTNHSERSQSASQSTSPQQFEPPEDYWSPQPIKIPSVPYSVSRAQWDSVEPTPIPSAATSPGAHWAQQSIHAPSSGQGRWISPSQAQTGEQYGDQAFPAGQYTEPASAAPQYAPDALSGPQYTARPYPVPPDFDFGLHISEQSHFDQSASQRRQYAQQTSVEAQYPRDVAEDVQYSGPSSFAPQYGPPNMEEWQARATSNMPLTVPVQSSPSHVIGAYVPSATTEESLATAPSEPTAAETSSYQNVLPTSDVDPLSTQSEQAAISGADSQIDPASASQPTSVVPEPSQEITQGLESAQYQIVRPAPIDIQDANGQHAEAVGSLTGQGDAAPATATHDESAVGALLGLSEDSSFRIMSHLDVLDYIHEHPQLPISVTDDIPARPGDPVVGKPHTRPSTPSVLEGADDGHSAKPSESAHEAEADTVDVEQHVEEAEAGAEAEAEVDVELDAEAEAQSEAEANAKTEAKAETDGAAKQEGSEVDAPHEEESPIEDQEPDTTAEPAPVPKNNRLSRADLALALAHSQEYFSSQSRSPEPRSLSQRRRSTTRRQSVASPAPQHINERAAIKAISSSSDPVKEADFQAPGTRVAAEGAYDPLLPSRVRVEDDGVPVLEELDTPATRRARALRRAAERKQQLLAEARKSESGSAVEEKDEAGPSMLPATSASAPVPARRKRGRGRPRSLFSAHRRRRAKAKGRASASVADAEDEAEAEADDQPEDGDKPEDNAQPEDDAQPEADAKPEADDSALSSLSSDDEQAATERAGGVTTSEAQDEDAEGEPDEDQDVDAEGSKPNGGRIRRKPLHPRAGQNLLNDNGYIDCGTLVWAKINAFPWWPGVVYENDQVDQIPRPVITKHKRRSRMYPHNKYFIVQFFDEKRSWQVVQLKGLVTLGDDLALDREMLEDQEFKVRKLRTELDAAYREAMDQMESDLEEDGAEA
ncbi:hypothetical protein GGF50DRAFT_118222 [Schizophyllum commune]